MMRFNNISWKLKPFPSISEHYLNASISLHLLKVYVKCLAVLRLFSFRSIDHSKEEEKKKDKEMKN